MAAKPIHWIEAAQAVEAASRILIVAHVFPDGDAIGALMGLSGALRERGKQVVAAVDGGTPPFLHYIPNSDTVVSELTEGAWDVMISVDSSDEKRTGLAGEYGRAHSSKVINLDHHVTNTYFGDLHLVVPSAVSSTEIVFDWLSQMQHIISQPVAVALLTGLVTDTMGFRTSNVSAHTLWIAHTLMLAGASLTEITARTLDSRSFSTINLWKYTFPSVELDGQIICANVTQEDLRRANINEITDGGLVSLLNSVNEAMVAAVFKETNDQQVELSLRSKTGYDVGQIAFSLGGGGHKQAAGATIAGTLNEVRQQVLPLLREVVKQGKLEIV